MNNVLGKHIVFDIDRNIGELKPRRYKICSQCRGDVYLKVLLKISNVLSIEIDREIRNKIEWL